MRLEGRTYLITGAAGGIGRAGTDRIIKEGGRVVALDLDGDTLSDMSDDHGASIHCMTGDASDPATIKQAVLAADNHFSRLDGAFLNAAMDGPMAPLLEVDIEDFDRVQALNVRGQYIAVQEVAKAMQKTGGAIVLTSSINGLRAIGNSSPYTVSKMAVLGLARAAAKDLSVYGIRVNTIHPGYIDTPMLSRAVSGLAPDAEDELMQALKAQVPLARVGNPTDIAAALVFLLSDDSSYMTGNQLIIDGGVVHAL